MSPFVAGPVTVDVPATSANLGPGFDSFGLALDFGDTLTGEVTGSSLMIEVHGEGEGQVPLNERHLVIKAMYVAFDAMGARPSGLRLTCENRIPHSRGLGSSSAAIVGGIRLAVALMADQDRRLDDQAILKLATAMEGHPDNAAPALLGGFVIAGTSLGDLWAHRFEVVQGLRLVVFVPTQGCRTEVARGLLPEQVLHRAAAANSSRAALLAVGLTQDTSLLLRGTEDFLHQDQRESAMPETLALVQRLRGLGVAAVISGAGPAVLAFVPEEGGPIGVAEVVATAPSGWSADAHLVATRGVSVRSAAPARAVSKSADGTG